MTGAATGRGVLVAGLFLAGTACSTATFTAEDLRVVPSREVLYLLARSPEVSRAICGALGGDLVRTEARLAAGESRRIPLGRVVGCYTVRDIIVCPEGDTICIAHEHRHRTEGTFHR